MMPDGALRRSARARTGSFLTACALLAACEAKPPEPRSTVAPSTIADAPRAIEPYEPASAPTPKRASAPTSKPASAPTPSEPSKRALGRASEESKRALGRASEEQSASAAGARRFGAASQLPGEPVPVEQVLAQADAYVGTRVKCSGKVARVCQAAGCWLELTAESGGEGLRVPMAGHAFFIPKDAVGQFAVIEGALIRQQLDPSAREHYQGEGMQAMGPLSLEATSVQLR